MTEKYPFQSLKLSIAALCEYALESRGRWTLVGTFRQLEFPAFPATLDRLEVYLLFTDVTRTSIDRVSVGLLFAEEFESPALIYQSAQPTGTKAPRSWECAFLFEDVVFDGPGQYNLLVEVGDDVFDIVVLHVQEQP